MKKRSIAFLLSLVMLLSLLTPTALAEEPDQEGQATEETQPTEPTTPAENEDETPTDPSEETPVPADPGDPGENDAETPDNGENGQENGENGNETPEAFDADAVYEALMACETVEEMDAIAAELTEEQIAQFSDEQLAAIEAYYAELKGVTVEDGDLEAPEFSNAGPIFTDEATSGVIKQVLKAALRSATKSFDAKDMVSLVEGLEVSKTATKTKMTDGEGNPLYQIDLSAAATSNIVTTSTPCDIVLVLDRSGSMDGKNVQALIKALNGDGTEANPGFLATIQKNSPNSRVAIVTYAGMSSWGVITPDSTIDTGTKSAEGALVPITENGAVNPELTSVVNRLANRCTGGTWAEYGLENATKIFQAIPESTDPEDVYNNQRVTILFTDGIPGSGEWSGGGLFSSWTAETSAQGSIHWSTILKHEKGDQTVLNYDQAFYDDATKWSASTFRGHLTGCGSKVFCVGLNLPSAGKTEGSSGAKVNEYLYRVSSHRSDGSHVTADTIQNAWERLNTKNGQIDWSKRYWDVYTRNRPEGSYFANGDTTALSSIFHKIAQQTGKPIENAVIRDYITPGFDICDSKGNIYQVGDTIQGDGYVGTVKEDANGVYVEWKEVTLDPGDANGEGKKEFKQTIYLKPDPEFWGGNQVPTNIDGISGVYDEDGKNIGSFPSPKKVDVPLNVPEITAVDKTIYYGNTAPTADDLFQMTKPADDWKTAYVKINAPVADSISNKECGQYTGSITVEPRYTGEYDKVSKSATAWVHVLEPSAEWEDITIYLGNQPKFTDPTSLQWADPNTDHTTGTPEGTAPTVTSFAYEPTADAKYEDCTQVQPRFTLNGKNFSGNTFTVHVLKPTVTWTDRQKYYGDTLSGFTATPVSVTWADGKDNKTTATAGQDAAPTLSYEFTIVGGIAGRETVMPNKDVNVSVKTKINGTDVTNHTTYGWQKAEFCTDKESKPAEAQFRIHPLTCTLTISKSGWETIDENQCFLFTYERTGGNSVNATIKGTVTVQGDGSVRITGLPIGTYQVSEDESWSWRYQLSGKAQSATLTPDHSEATLAFHNDRTNVKWLNGCSLAVNNWASTQNAN